MKGYKIQGDFPSESPLFLLRAYLGAMKSEKKSESRVKPIKRELDRNLFTFFPRHLNKLKFKNSIVPLQQLEQAKNLLKYSKSKCIVQMSQHQRFFSYSSLHSFHFPSSRASGVYMSTWVILHISIHTHKVLECTYLAFLWSIIPLCSYTFVSCKLLCLACLDAYRTLHHTTDMKSKYPQDNAHFFTFRPIHFVVLEAFFPSSPLL